MLEERENGTFNEVVGAQVEALFSLSAEDFAKIVVAYEPVWAIGTGKTATAEQAQDMHAHIRKTIEQKYGKDVADNTSILYGGSCKPGNARELFAKPDVDGGLIGGAALKADSFMGIIDEIIKKNPDMRYAAADADTLCVGLGAVEYPRRGERCRRGRLRA